LTLAAMMEASSSARAGGAQTSVATASKADKMRVQEDII
jgi:hypothetical protein